jgi:hypothetical protein
VLLQVLLLLLLLLLRALRLMQEKVHLGPPPWGSRLWGRCWVGQPRVLPGKKQQVAAVPQAALMLQMVLQEGVPVVLAVLEVALQGQLVCC